MRRRYKSSVQYPLTIARGDIGRNRGFEKPSGMRNAKRVRFEDSEEMDGTAVHASSAGREATQSPICNAPKTSEYAYFKKVKNGFVHGHSHARHKENEQLKSSKTNYLTRDTRSASHKLKHCMEDVNFSVSGERAGPSDHNLFLSPHVGKYDKSDEIRNKELTKQIRKRTALPSENVTPVGQSLFSSPLNGASENSENQCSVNGIFTEKRLRLRQWVTHTCSEVEKLPMGFNLVSSLLSRLIPKGKVGNDSSMGDANNNTISLTLDKSNNLENGRYLSHKRHLDKDLRKISSGRSSDTILTEWDSFVAGFPSNYHKESHVHDKSVDPDRYSKSRKSSSNSQNGFPSCLPFESHRSSGSFHFKDLDEFGSIIGNEREPIQLLLEWDSELGKDRLNSSIVNHGTEMSMCATLPYSWDADQPSFVDNLLEANMWSSSLLSNCYLESNALPNYGSHGGLMHDFEPNFDDVKCKMAEAEQFSRALPCNLPCITLAEDKYGEHILSNSKIIFPYGDQDWLTKKVWDGKPPREFWWKCLSAAEDYLSVWQFPENEKNFVSISRLKESPGEEAFTPLYEGAFNRCFLSPILQSSLSLDTFINRPLLLNHGSPEQELNFEDYGNKLGYRKVL